MSPLRRRGHKSDIVRGLRWEDRYRLASSHKALHLRSLNNCRYAGDTPLDVRRAGVSTGLHWMRRYWFH